MDKLNPFSENKADLKDYDDSYSFSFFQFILKVVITLNVFVILFLISDYFIAPKVIYAKCGIVYQQQLEVNYPDGKYDNILIKKEIAEKIKGGETIKYYSTPIFNHSKYLVIELTNNRELKISDYDIGFVLLFIITNTLSFVFLILFPGFYDRWVKNYDDSIVSLLFKPYNYFSYSYLTLLLTGVPMIMGLYYMYELYNYFIH